jgi:hypothetical protein
MASILRTSLKHRIRQVEAAAFTSRRCASTIPANSKSGEFIRLEEKYGAHNYHPLPVVFSRAKGVSRRQPMSAYLCFACIFHLRTCRGVHVGPRGQPILRFLECLFSGQPGAHNVDNFVHMLDSQARTGEIPIQFAAGSLPSPTD